MIHCGAEASTEGCQAARTAGPVAHSCVSAQGDVQGTAAAAAHCASPTSDSCRPLLGAPCRPTPSCPGPGESFLPGQSLLNTNSKHTNSHGIESPMLPRKASQAISCCLQVLDTITHRHECSGQCYEITKYIPNRILAVRSLLSRLMLFRTTRHNCCRTAAQQEHHGQQPQTAATHRLPEVNHRMVGRE